MTTYECTMALWLAWLCSRDEAYMGGMRPNAHIPRRVMPLRLVDFWLVTTVQKGSPAV